MNNNAKPNSPDDALFGNSADDLADDLNNDIDVPVYRRDAQKPADATPPAKATKIDKPGEETVGGETVESSAAEDAKPEAPERGKVSEGEAKSARKPVPAESDASADASAEIPGAEAPEAEASVEEKPAKRDIYAVLGRARPQRIESRPPEPEVDLSKLDSSQSAAGTRADASAASGASDRWGKVDDANPAEQATASTNDQAFIRPAKNGADTDRSTAGAGAAGADAGAADAGVTDADTATGTGGAGAAAGAGAGVVGAGTTAGADTDRSTAGASVAGADAGVTDADTDRSTAGAGVAGADAGVTDAGTTAGAGAAGAGVVGAGTTAGADTVAESDSAGVGHDAADAGVAGASAVAEVKRGTTSFGLFILRAVLGAYLLVRGLQTLFAFGGDPGVDVFQTQLENYNFTDILAIGIPVAEVVAGGLLLLGLVTPFGAALATIVGGFMAFHNLDSFQGTLWPYGLNPHVQLWAALTVASISLIFLGPGRISLDRSRGWATRPLASAWIFFVVAAAATAGLWLGVGGGNPFN
ncbi:DoxX family protein [Corynebacterium evansiae]|uniref:DoxX family protein n=1 Tax=Corynebacterium evansiae TaxID=2913499 RepID=UPI003EBE72EC